jgi:hypothetical protein
VLNKDNEFSAVIHPGYYLANVDGLPYERNPKSLAHIPFGEGKNYYQGCLYGGWKDKFVEMCNLLSKDVDEDVRNGIIASVIDESYMNRYFINKNIFEISPVYAYPEQILQGSEGYSGNSSYEKLYNQNPIVIQIDKRLLGGHDFLRS